MRLKNPAEWYMLYTSADVIDTPHPILENSITPSNCVDSMCSTVSVPQEW